MADPTAHMREGTGICSNPNLSMAFAAGVESSPHQIGRRRRFGRSPFSPVGGGAESAWWRAARPQHPGEEAPGRGSPHVSAVTRPWFPDAGARRGRADESDWWRSERAGDPPHVQSPGETRGFPPGDHQSRRLGYFTEHWGPRSPSTGHMEQGGTLWNGNQSSTAQHIQSPDALPHSILQAEEQFTGTDVEDLRPPIATSGGAAYTEVWQAFNNDAVEQRCAHQQLQNRVAESGSIPKQWQVQNEVLKNEPAPSYNVYWGDTIR